MEEIIEVEMDISELKEFLRENPDLKVRITVKGGDHEGSKNKTCIEGSNR